MLGLSRQIVAAWARRVFAREHLLGLARLQLENACEVGRAFKAQA